MGRLAATDKPAEQTLAQFIEGLANFVHEGQLELETELRAKEREKLAAERAKIEEMNRINVLVASLLQGLDILRQMPGSRLDYTKKEDMVKIVVSMNIPLRDVNAAFDDSKRRMEIHFFRNSDKMRLGVDPYTLPGDNAGMDDGMIFEGHPALKDMLALIARYAGKKGLIPRG